MPRGSLESELPTGWFWLGRGEMFFRGRDHLVLARTVAGSGKKETVGGVWLKGIFFLHHSLICHSCANSFDKELFDNIYLRAL